MGQEEEVRRAFGIVRLKIIAKREISLKMVEINVGVREKQYGSRRLGRWCSAAGIQENVLGLVILETRTKKRVMEAE